MAKKSNKTKDLMHILVAVICVIIIAVAVFIAVGNKDDNSPQYEKTDEISSSEILSSEKEPDSTNDTTAPTEVTTAKQPDESTTVKPTITSPITKPLTNSFYDSVKYRSPDAVPADIFKHGRNLMLLNRQYELPDNFKWDLVYWANGNSVDAMYLNCEEHNSVKAVDRAAYQPLKDMFADADAAGVPLQLVSAYRSIYLQDKLFTRSVNSYMSQGYSEADAINKANYSRTFSGTSEHNTGLGFDILQKGNYTLSESFENTAQFKWLMENAENYGFILRYQKDKTSTTGIMYEPWHFRYVGVEHAKKINDLGFCLEEYIEYLEA